MDELIYMNERKKKLLEEPSEPCFAIYPGIPVKLDWLAARLTGKAIPTCLLTQTLEDDVEETGEISAEQSAS